MWQDYCVVGFSFLFLFSVLAVVPGLLNNKHGGKPQARLLGPKVCLESWGTLHSPAALNWSVTGFPPQNNHMRRSPRLSKMSQWTTFLKTSSQTAYTTTEMYNEGTNKGYTFISRGSWWFKCSTAVLWDHLTSALCSALCHLWEGIWKKIKIYFSHQSSTFNLKCIIEMCIGVKFYRLRILLCPGIIMTLLCLLDLYTRRICFLKLFGLIFALLLWAHIKESCRCNFYTALMMGKKNCPLLCTFLWHWKKLSPGSLGNLVKVVPSIKVSSGASSPKIIMHYFLYDVLFLHISCLLLSYRVIYSHQNSFIKQHIFIWATLCW